MSKESIGECWTHSIISGLSKPQLKSMLVFLHNFSLCELSRTNLKEKKPVVFTLKVCVLTHESLKNWHNRPESYMDGISLSYTKRY